MNISEAEKQLKYAAECYLEKDQDGEYIIPLEEQRPLFLYGPPGIGKTAIAAQAAEELHLGFLSYSLTHHTRQTALGLPFITEKRYQGKTVKISSYTMSEIVASVYDLMEETGIKEGILFLDELNCVSETLAPAILRFLQFKEFGQYKIPEGWVIVTAGNPTEYNAGARNFDLVTLDRVKKITVEPDYSAWRTYAVRHGVHPLVLSYLDTRKEDFYSVETTVDGTEFVTARAWMDLSTMLKLYEKKHFPVDENLIMQYVQNERIARSFASYCDLFYEYKRVYPVDDILRGREDEETVRRAHDASLDERLVLLQLIFDRMKEPLREIYRRRSGIRDLERRIKQAVGQPSRHRYGEMINILQDLAAELSDTLEQARKSGSSSEEEQKITRSEIRLLTMWVKELLHEGSERGRDDKGSVAGKLIADRMNEQLHEMKQKIETSRGNLEHVFQFCEKAFGLSHEMLILVTELTADFYCADFISHYGCPSYDEYCEKLQFTGRRTQIRKDLQEMSAQDAPETQKSGETKHSPQEDEDREQ